MSNELSGKSMQLFQYLQTARNAGCSWGEVEETVRQQFADADIAALLAQHGDVANLKSLYAEMGSVAGKPKTWAFNDPANGIFARNFRDRDGLPVGDTCIWTLRGHFFGSRSRDWSDDLHRSFAALLSSEQIAQFNDAVSRSLEGYRHISDNPFWEKHKEEGIFFTPEFRAMLPSMTDNQMSAIADALGINFPAGNLDQNLVQEKINNFRYEYMLLDRLKQDCEYYLGAGNGSKKHLWALDENAQIKKMREIYTQLPDKPEWLTLAQIEQYAQKMKVTSFDPQHTLSSDGNKDVAKDVGSNCFDTPADAVRGAWVHTVESEKGRKLQGPATQSLMDDAQWVMSFLRAIEESGNHAPTETMQRLIDAISGLQASPRIVIGLEGGIIQGATANVPIEYLVYDYDIEGADDDEVAVRPALDGGEVEVFNSGVRIPEVDAAIIDKVFAAAEVSMSHGDNTLSPTM